MRVDCLFAELAREDGISFVERGVVLFDVFGTAPDLFGAEVALPHLVLATANQHFKDLRVLTLVDVFFQSRSFVFVQFAIQLRFEVLESEIQFLAFPGQRRL